MYLSIAQGIVVKIVAKKLGQHYYKKKAVVEEVIDLYTAVVRVQELGDRIKIDQAQLETVIPAIGWCYVGQKWYSGVKIYMPVCNMNGKNTEYCSVLGKFHE